MINYPPLMLLFPSEVDSFWPGLFAKALEGQNVASLISNIGSGAGAAPAAAAPAAAAPAGKT